MRDTNGTTHYGWDGDSIVREETDSQRTTVVYEPGSFVPMLRIDDTQQGQVLCAYITDALGTPMQLVTPNGQPRWLAKPNDWAAVKNQRAVRNVTQPIRFQGQWSDEESGLYYNRHRYYDPQQGRYISQDQIGLNGGTNLYGYVTNPISMVDTLGLSGYLGTDLSRFTSGSVCEEGRVGNGITGYDEHGVPTFDESHPSFHHYYGSNSCTKGVAGCSYENAMTGLLRYPAPGGTGEEPITNGQTSFAMPVGSVRHAVIDGDYQVVNITLPCRHSLHPGI